MPLGLYISVPFCRTKCSYCNFASGVFSASQMAHYVERLSADVRAVRGFAVEHGAEIPEPVDTIYLGGGTPSLLPPDELKEAVLCPEAGVQSSPQSGNHCGMRSRHND